MQRKSSLVLLVAAITMLAYAPAHAARATSGGTSSIACNDGTVTWTPTSLWPPNHKMQTINISYADSDGDGDSTMITVGAITDNQSASDGSDELQGSGNPAEGLDWSGTGNTGSGSDGGNAAATTAQVRAERSGTDKTGRVYTINVTCTDTGGNSSADSGEQGSNMEMQTVQLTVTVPHDRRPTS